ncbi:MAG: hypothetical protein AAB489_03220 [Patescibacteria group bacterium]
MAFKPTGNTVESRLDKIVEHLERMDRRDRLRTWGGFVRSLIALVPMIIFLLSAWYLYNNTDEMLKKITEEAAKQAAKYTEQSAGKLMEKFK